MTAGTRLTSDEQPAVSLPGAEVRASEARGGSTGSSTVMTCAAELDAAGRYPSSTIAVVHIYRRAISPTGVSRSPTSWVGVHSYAGRRPGLGVAVGMGLSVMSRRRIESKSG
jgi:hypothetical protein